MRCCRCRHKISQGRQGAAWTYAVARHGHRTRGEGGLAAGRRHARQCHPAECDRQRRQARLRDAYPQRRGRTTQAQGGWRRLWTEGWPGRNDDLRAFSVPIESERKLLERDEIRTNRHRALSYYLTMIFSENRYPLFRIML